jgi:hypothetical protein
MYKLLVVVVVGVVVASFVNDTNGQQNSSSKKQEEEPRFLALPDPGSDHLSLVLTFLCLWQKNIPCCHGDFLGGFNSEGFSVVPMVTTMDFFP